MCMYLYGCRLPSLNIFETGYHRTEKKVFKDFFLRADARIQKQQHVQLWMPDTAILIAHGCMGHSKALDLRQRRKSRRALLNEKIYLLQQRCSLIIILETLNYTLKCIKLYHTKISELEIRKYRKLCIIIIRLTNDVLLSNAAYTNYCT